MADTKWIDVDHYLFKFMNPTPKYTPDRPLHMGNYKSRSVIIKIQQQKRKTSVSKLFHNDTQNIYGKQEAIINLFIFH